MLPLSIQVAVLSHGDRAAGEEGWEVEGGQFSPKI